MAGHDDDTASHIEVKVDVIPEELLLEINEPEREAENDEQSGHQAQVYHVLLTWNIIKLHLVVLISGLLIAANTFVALIIAILQIFQVNFFCFEYDLFLLEVFDSV